MRAVVYSQAVSAAARFQCFLASIDSPDATIGEGVGQYVVLPGKAATPFFYLMRGLHLSSIQWWPPCVAAPFPPAFGRGCLHPICALAFRFAAQGFSSGVWHQKEQKANGAGGNDDSSWHGVCWEVPLEQLLPRGVTAGGSGPAFAR